MKVGITGGIGSGKSFVCRRLEAIYGIEIYDCDSAAKRLMRTSAAIRSALTCLIGPGTYAGQRLNKGSAPYCSSRDSTASWTALWPWQPLRTSGCGA